MLKKLPRKWGNDKNQGNLKEKIKQRQVNLNVIGGPEMGNKEKCGVEFLKKCEKGTSHS